MVNQGGGGLPTLSASILVVLARQCYVHSVKIYHVLSPHRGAIILMMCSMQTKLDSRTKRRPESSEAGGDCGANGSTSRNALIGPQKGRHFLFKKCLTERIVLQAQIRRHECVRAHGNHDLPPAGQG